MTRWFPITLGSLYALLLAASMAGKWAGVWDHTPDGFEFLLGVVFGVGAALADERCLLAHRPKGPCLAPADTGLTLLDRDYECYGTEEDR